MDMKLKNVRFKVVGVTFKNEDGSDRQRIISEMSDNSPVILKREPNNTYDRNAVMVIYLDRQIGYIAKQYAELLAPMMDSGRRFIARVDKTGFYEGINFCHIIVNEE